jgi:fatty acyl-CoA reductase
MLSALKESPKITVVSGDISLPSLGLSETDQEHVRATSTIFIHAASSLSLGARLASIAPNIIEASLELAKLALSCPGLERFVYISTAYANSHLHQQHEGIETRVEEKIYPLLPSDDDLLNASPEDEYINIKLQGTSKQFQLSDFPWAYGYAKHLTERLLLKKFQEDQISGSETETELSSVPSKILIIRPSIIGPSQIWPYANFEVPGSVPSSTLAAALITEPSRKINFASRMDDPWTDATTDEISVDMVVNHILMHLIYDSHGIVHAAAPKDQLVSMADIMRGVTRIRRLPWMPKIVWKNVHWRSRELCTIARIFVILGTSYDFCQDSNERLLERMSTDELENFPLHPSRHPVVDGFYDLTHRREAILACVETILKRKGRPAWISRFLWKNSTGRSVKKC